MLQYFSTFFGFSCSDVPTADLLMNKLGANRYGKKQTKRLKLGMNSTCFQGRSQDFSKGGG